MIPLSLSCDTEELKSIRKGNVTVNLSMKALALLSSSDCIYAFGDYRQTDKYVHTYAHVCMYAFRTWLPTVIERY